MASILVNKTKVEEIRRQRRREFVEKHFSNDIQNFSTLLMDDASKMEEHPREFVVRAPRELNFSHVRATLIGYFQDCGYNVAPMSETQDHDFVKIVVT
jgi:putative N-acetylmannosamine-6-phosphate epimerase